MQEIDEFSKKIEVNTDKLISAAEKRKIKKRPTGNRTKIINNDLQPIFLSIDFKEPWPLWVDDVFAGVCRLDWYRNKERSIPLSAIKLVKIFSTLSEISTYNISHLFAMSERQAQRYLKACEISYPYLLKGFLDTSIYTMRYTNT